MNAAAFLRLVSAVGAEEGTADNLTFPAGRQSDPLANAKAALARIRHRKRLFGDLRLVDGPGWEMLLDLYVNHLEGKNLCIGSLCVTSGVPMTNAVRILAKLFDKGLVDRRPDPDDRRRCMIALGDEARDKLDRYFASS